MVVSPIAVADQLTEHPALEQIQRWCDGIEHFITWQARYVLHAKPSATIRQEHQESLKWLLRMTRLIYAVTSDPEFPDRKLRLQLESQMHQLETSWETVYNPMPAAEAEKILAEAFPK